MAFRYTPTPTPSITPTISLTPSITPSFTPTGTSCPGTSPTPTNTPTSTNPATPTQTPTNTSTPTNTPSQTNTPTQTISPSATPCSLIIYFDVSQSPGTQGWDTATDACNGTGTPLTVYFSNFGGCPTTFQDVFDDGKVIYTNVALTNVLAGNNKFYKSVSAPNSGIAIQVDNSGFITTLSTPC